MLGPGIVLSAGFLVVCLADDSAIGNPGESSPYGLPESALNSAADDPDAADSVVASLFDAPENAAWVLGVSIAGNVSLKGAEDGSGEALGDDDVTQLTVLSLRTSDGGENALEGCVVVLGGARHNLEVDPELEATGSCGMLSQECQSQLMGSPAIDQYCHFDINTFPRPCDPFFAKYPSAWNSNISFTSQDPGLFFAQASDPQEEGSEDARDGYDAAAQQVWPVALYRFTDEGVIGQSELACVQAVEDDDGESVYRDESEAGPDDGGGSEGAGGKDVDATRASTFGAAGALLAAVLIIV